MALFKSARDALVRVDAALMGVTPTERDRIMHAPVKRRMTYEVAAAIVASITYKPGWTIGCTYEGMNTVRIHLRFTALDSVRQQEEAAVAASFAVNLDWIRDEDYLVDFVRSCITQAEMHERDEWFRYQGLLVDDPHRPGRDGRMDVALP